MSEIDMTDILSKMNAGHLADTPPATQEAPAPKEPVQRTDEPVATADASDDSSAPQTELRSVSEIASDLVAAEQNVVAQQQAYMTAMEEAQRAYEAALEANEGQLEAVNEAKKLSKELREELRVAMREAGSAKFDAPEGYTINTKPKYKMEITDPEAAVASIRQSFPTVADELLVEIPQHYEVDTKKLEDHLKGLAKAQKITTGEFNAGLDGVNLEIDRSLSVSAPKAPAKPELESLDEPAAKAKAPKGKGKNISK